jgi:hypothetical protein
MKIREGFVSNSSSSSFIVIGSSGIDTRIPDSAIIDGVLDLRNIGETEFGWGPENYYDILDRLSLCDVALEILNDEESRGMLQEVLTENDDRIKSIVVHLDIPGSNDGWTGRYIDHQSVLDLCRMYHSKAELRDFIFDGSSYISTDNDNH